MRTKASSITALLLATCMIVVALSGCSGRGGSGGTSARGFSSRERITSEDTVDMITPDFRYQVEEKQEINGDTVGWVEVPGTNISDVVVQRPDDETNNYYLRRNFEGESYFNGVYYADYRATFGNGSREQLGTNTCIYGHAITDNPEDTRRYDIKFGQLHNYRDPEFAKAHPYIYFSTPEENMVFEVIAVFYGNTDNPAFAYNSNPSGKDFVKIIEETVLPRSLYHYAVDVGTNDKFLTLSTCIYDLEDGTHLDYNAGSEYRFAVMAKLVDPEESLVTEAVFDINDELVVDPDGKWSVVGG